MVNWILIIILERFDTTSPRDRLWQLNGFTWNEDHPLLVHIMMNLPFGELFWVNQRFFHFIIMEPKPSNKHH